MYQLDLIFTGEQRRFGLKPIPRADFDDSDRLRKRLARSGEATPREGACCSEFISSSSHLMAANLRFVPRVFASEFAAHYLLPAPALKKKAGREQGGEISC